MRAPRPDISLSRDALAEGSKTGVFMFSDMTGSTRIAAESANQIEGAPFAKFLACHNVIVNAAVEAAGGRIGNRWGDGVLSLYERSPAALLAVLNVWRGIDRNRSALRGVSPEPLQVRCGIHRGSYRHFGEGWEKLVVAGTSLRNMPLPKPGEAGEYVGYDIAVTQRVQTAATAEYPFAISANILDDLSNCLTWRPDETPVGRLRFRSRDLLVFPYDFLLHKKPEMKNVMNPPAVYLVEGRVSFATNRLRDYGDISLREATTRMAEEYHVVEGPSWLETVRRQIAVQTRART